MELEDVEKQLEDLSDRWRDIYAELKKVDAEALSVVKPYWDDSQKLREFIDIFQVPCCSSAWLRMMERIGYLEIGR